ncbi:MAG TPA: hypothetical protein VMS64_30890 [Candidatus Methylomirabilis sp.]|nr:hypothetical protein [Candidatus Methylomirabilis sp.]
MADTLSHDGNIGINGASGNRVMVVTAVNIGRDGTATTSRRAGFSTVSVRPSRLGPQAPPINCPFVVVASRYSVLSCVWRIAAVKAADYQYIRLETA